jgi:hypothetical protein
MTLSSWYYYSMRSLLMPLFFLTFSLLPALVNAQGLDSIGRIQPELNLTPTFPEPGVPVTIAITNLIGDRAGASIRWEVNGESFPNLNNSREIEVTAPDLGEETVVAATLTLGTGRVERISTSIVPNYLDVIIEPQTHVPSFYTGRARPTVGSTVNVTALLFGITESPEDLVYTWRVNGQAIDGGSVRGGFKTNFRMPADFEVVLSLDVSTPSGRVLARTSEVLIGAEPELHFYENHTLYGLSSISLDNRFLNESTMTVVASPYYLDSLIYNDPDIIEWEIDGRDVATPVNNPYEITVSANDSVGSSQVSFRVQSTTRFLQFARNSIRIFY